MATKGDEEQEEDQWVPPPSAIEGIWFDSKNYWTRLANGDWGANQKADLMDDICFSQGLKPPQARGVLCQVRNEHRISGVFPFTHNPAELVHRDGHTFLNIATRKIIQPADHDEPSPWLDEVMENAWDDPRELQRDTFKAWFQRLYTSAKNGDMKAGQAIILAGPTGTGKSLLMRKVVGAALGGFTDAAEYLLGKTSFNKEAAESSVWCVDDSRGAATWEKHAEFSGALKRYVANPQIPYHPKYLDATTVTWRGRITVTCNLDTESLSILPDMDESISEKLMLFLGSGWKADFTDPEAMIARELPFYLRKLLAWTPPAEVLSPDPRFGIKSFHHPTLLNESTAMAAHGMLAEMLPYAIATALPNDEKDKERWMNGVEIRAMLDTDGLRSGLQKFAGNRLGIALSKMVGMPGSSVLSKRVTKTCSKYLIDLRPQKREHRRVG